MTETIQHAQTTLITGASSGIGRELAPLFAADGCDLILVARRGQRLAELADQLRAMHSVRVEVIAQDLTAPGAGEAVERQVRAAGLTVDTLVNNAGFGAVGPLAELSLADQLEMVQLNAATVAELSRRFLPGMIERGRGAILNIASTAAFQPGGNMAVYFATKAFVLSLSEALAEETRKQGVRVCCLCPGPTATEFADRSGIDQTVLFRFGTMTAATVARRGYQALRSRRVVVVPGLVNWLVTLSLRFSPRWLVRRVAARLMSRVG